MFRMLLLAAALFAWFTLNANAEQCYEENPSPSMTIPLPGNPFAVVPSQDGCWVFVSMAGAHGGIAVLKRGVRRFEITHVVALAAVPTGMVLTHDGKMLIVAGQARVFFLDVARMTAGKRDALLGSIGKSGVLAGTIYVNVTADDNLLFVSDEAAANIAVIDLEHARSDGFSSDVIIGAVPVGMAPIALTFSKDGTLLYTTSEAASPDWNWPAACKQEGRKNPAIVNPEGAVVVVDVERVKEDPAGAVVARIPAGCSPVRAALSPAGDRLFVTARNSNAVIVFDPARFLSDPEHARIGLMPVGKSPVPVAVVDGGTKVLAGNSDRFGAPGSPQTLTVLDAKVFEKGAGAVLGTIRVGAFPREMRVSADGNTLFLTNARSKSLQVLDVKNLPISAQ
jgi:DNA-binding beta-propeller fold protein YncE